MFQEYLASSISVLEDLQKNKLQDKIEAALAEIIPILKKGLPLMVCGNGGSAADADHITAELVGRFFKERKALNAICLSASTATLTAWSNDYDYNSVFARGVEAHGQNGGFLIGLSTSGNSKNVIQAFEKAKAMGVRTLALTGQGGGELVKLGLCDHLLEVPSKITPYIQQGHLCLYHYLCRRIEDAFITSPIFK